MRRSKDLIELSRREVCGLACATIALAGCSGGPGPIQTGALGPGGDDTQVDANDGSGAPDASNAHPTDAAHATVDGGGVSNPDAATSSSVACTTTATDVGTASAIQLNTPVYHSGGFFVVRDASGLYAVSAACTHEGALMSVSGSDYRCPRHGALFKFDGTIVSGPVSQPLVHYAMCNLANGNLGVETSLTVPKAQRLPG